MQNLMIIALGPVQDFIASARRSRDLWYGSWLLSDWSKTAARTISEQCGLSALIFPNPKDARQLAPESSLGVANKIVAIVPGDAAAVAKLAETVEAAVRFRLNDEIAKHVFDEIGDANLDDRALAARQVADLVEFFWAAHQLADDESNYASVRRNLEALLAARKTTRTFRQFEGRPNQPKSSLDGIRESVIPKLRYPSRNDPEAGWNRKARQLYDLYGAGPAEQLSGVDLVKRMGSEGEHFPSTSHIAALPYLKRFQGQDISTALDALITALHECGVEPDIVHVAYANTPLGRFDGSLLYGSRLLEEVKTEREREKLLDLLEAFFRRLDDDARPQPYYALLHADGDRMGATIDALDRPSTHAGISAALNGFASTVSAIIVQHEGAPVYSGGDDVLAFLPLHTALTCARALADEFHRALAAFKDKDGKSPSLSVGIAVTHHIEPMADALRLARFAEGEAKKVDGKDALAVVVSKRSGVDRVVAAPRRELDERLRLLIALHRQDAIPDGAAYQIQDIFRRLGVDPKADSPAARDEAVRILMRKRSAHGQADIAEATRTALVGWIRNSAITLPEFVNELIVARLFADAESLALLPLEEHHASLADRTA